MRSFISDRVAWVGRLPPDDPRRGPWLSDLSHLVQELFQQSGERADIDLAVELGRRALGHFPQRPRPGPVLNSLGLALLDRGRSYGRADDLDEATMVLREAVTGPPGTEPGPDDLANLATALLDRRRHRPVGGSPGLDDSGGDVAEAIELLERAVRASAPDDPERAGWLSNLAHAHLAANELTGEPGSLEAAEVVALAALESAPAGGAAAVNAASALGEARRRMVSERNVADAVTAARSALAGIAEDDPRFPVYQHNLATVLVTRYELLRAGSDLRAAVEAFERAVARTAPDSPDIVARSNGLSVALLQAARMDSGQAATTRAVAAARAAVAHTPGDHPDRLTVLTNLARALTAAARRRAHTVVQAGQQRGRPMAPGDFGTATQEIRATVDEAVSVLETVVSRTPGSSPRHPGRSALLAEALQARVELFGVGAGDGYDDDQQRSVALLRAAAGNGQRPVDQAKYLGDLGVAVYAGFERSGDKDDFVEAFVTLRRVAVMAAAPVTTRIAAAEICARICARENAWGRAAEMYRIALDLLPRTVWQGIDQASGHRLLVWFAGLASDALACAVAAADPASSLTSSEAGRGVLWNQLLNRRTDLTGLAERHPALAERLRATSLELDRMAPLADAEHW